MAAIHLLSDIDCGGATAELIPLVYDELRRLAAHYLRRESSRISLQPTALVHEAYVELTTFKKSPWQNRAQFFAVAAQVMRRILVAHARRRKAVKRGGGNRDLSLDMSLLIAGKPSIDFEALHNALERLEHLNPSLGRIVELRYFGGLTVE
jgi:RNA polymerase sigma-70 factor (ECF subfamily)